MFKIIGYTNSGRTQFPFYSVKEDIEEDITLEQRRGGDNSLFTNQKSSKGVITLDMDWVNQSDYGNLKEALHNSSFTGRVYVREPSLLSQNITFGTVSSMGLYLASNNRKPSLSSIISGASVFSSGEKSTLDGYGTSVVKSTSSYDYMHYLFVIPIDTWFANGGSFDLMTRLTTIIQNLRAFSNAGNLGYTADFYNVNTQSWTEVKRQSLTFNANNYIGFGLRNVQDFTQFQDYVDYSSFSALGTLLLKITPIQSRPPSGSISLSCQHIEHFINGYFVKQGSNFNYNWRSEITTQGYSGQLTLLEI